MRLSEVYAGWAHYVEQIGHSDGVARAAIREAEWGQRPSDYHNLIGREFYVSFRDSRVTNIEPKEIDDMTVQQRVREWIDTEGRKFVERGSNAYFGFIHKDGTNSGKIESGACHATVLSYGQLSRVPVAAIISRINRATTTSYNQSEHSVRYYDWLFNRSPVSSAFMYKGAKERMKDGWCVVSANNPANLVQAALIGSRNSWEFPKNIEKWVKLVDMGVNENLAYLVVHFLADLDKTTITLTARSHQHVMVGPGLSLKGARAFVFNQPLNLKDKYSRGAHGNGVFDLWDSNGRSSTFVDKMKEEIKDSLAGGKKARCMNPFAAAKKKPGDENRISITYEQLARFLIERQDKILGVT